MKYLITPNFLVRLTDPQVELYKTFLDLVDKEGGADLRKRLLSDYHIFSRIWTHPYQLIHHATELEKKQILNDGYDSFIDDDEDDSDASDSEDEVASVASYVFIRMILFNKNFLGFQEQ